MYYSFYVYATCSNRYIARSKRYDVRCLSTSRVASATLSILYHITFLNPANNMNKEISLSKWQDSVVQNLIRIRIINSSSCPWLCLSSKCSYRKLLFSGHTGFIICWVFNDAVFSSIDSTNVMDVITSWRFSFGLHRPAWQWSRAFISAKWQRSRSHSAGALAQIRNIILFLPAKTF